MHVQGAASNAKSYAPGALMTWQPATFPHEGVLFRDPSRALKRRNRTRG